MGSCGDKPRYLGLPGYRPHGILLADEFHHRRAVQDGDSHQEGTAFRTWARLLGSRQSWSLDDRA